MKKIVFLFLVLVVLLSACSHSNRERSPVPYSQLEFKLEDYPDFIGSYSLSRSNFYSKWNEWGEWRSSVELFLTGSKVCFEYFYQDDWGTFRSNPDYEWKECYRGKETCLCLKKRK